LALLISGGHTQLVHSKKLLEYEVVGETLDDAVGEAFDKVARMLELPYPGGPEIAKLAHIARENNVDNPYTLPRPMIHSDNLNFSFSGLKTAVLYTLKKVPILTPGVVQQVAREFEDAAVEVLVHKTKKALEKHAIKTLLIGGGVAANTHIGEKMESMIKNFSDTTLLIPDKNLTGDNAIMIGVAGYFRAINKIPEEEIVADGNKRL
jgi:N6-L-threonylcarbamoyladenine synthase